MCWKNTQSSQTQAATKIKNQHIGQQGELKIAENTAAFETIKKKLEDKYGGTLRQFAINLNELSRTNLKVNKINFNLIALDKQSMWRNRDLVDTLVINLFDNGPTEESGKVPHNIKV